MGMSAAETSSAAPTSGAVHSSWVLDREPHERAEAAPEGSDSKARIGVSSAALLGCLAVAQLAWLGGLAYLGQRLLL